MRVVGPVVDVQRVAWKITEQNGGKTCTAWCPPWLYREIDSEITELPWAKVFITGDRNGDGVLTSDEVGNAAFFKRLDRDGQ